MKTDIKHRQFFKVTRHAMYKNILTVLKDYDPNGKLAMFISSGGPLEEMMNGAKVEHFEFPAFDICNEHPSLPKYDYVVCDQVLEHVENPFDAVKNMFSFLISGGILILTSVFAYPIHKYPVDYWRFTPDALRLLCKPYASSILECSGHGHQNNFKIIADRRQNGQLAPTISHPMGFNININNPETPMMVWVIAQK